MPRCFGDPRAWCRLVYLRFPLGANSFNQIIGLFKLQVSMAQLDKLAVAGPSSTRRSVLQAEPAFSGAWFRMGYFQGTRFIHEVKGYPQRAPESIPVGQSESVRMPKPY